jgi:hypothetical protein
MNAEGTSWWLYLPPCPRCGQSHVLQDCTARLPWEMAGYGLLAPEGKR